MSFKLFTIPGVLVLLLLGIAGSSRLDGQARDRVDHRGTVFRLAFLDTDGDGAYPTYYVTVSSEVSTRGTITYEANGLTLDVSIPVPNEAVRIKLDTFLLLVPDPVSEVPISRKTLTMRFDDEVTVYGINTLRWSSDAFLALPVNSLGEDHIIMSYPNTAQIGRAGQIFETSDFPSQFAIIADQNGTRINIDPTVPVNGRPDADPFSVQLNAGEVFFAQAKEEFRLPQAGRDVTGTRITSDKPIVVYGSHQRTNIPWNDAVGRDHLVEQMPPIEHLGTRAMVTPHVQIPKTVVDQNFMRILATEPGTRVMIDSLITFFPAPGVPLQLPLLRAQLVTSNKPIAVAQYQHSTVDVEFISLPNDTVGDPFMMLVPSREKFDTSYAFESWNTKDFLYHFINVVIPTERISSLRVDGAPVNATFQRIPKTSYSYAQIELRAGSHHVTARVPFGLYSYGYGPYNSYGFPGGMVFDSIFKDHQEPAVSWRDTCGGVVGEAFDSAEFSFGMETVRLKPSSSNVGIRTEPFQPGDDSIRFSLPLVDPYQDGEAHIVAVDTAGLERNYIIPVKGFTLQLEQGPPPLRLDTLASLNGLEFCTSISVHNYGKFPQNLENVRFTDPVMGLRVDEQFPITIQPGQSESITICFQRAGDTSALVDIGLDNGCDVRDVATLPVVSGLDTTAPSLTYLTDRCEEDVIFTIDERYALNSGVASITFRARQNVDVLVPESYPAKSARVELRRRSIWKDVVYDIEVVDVVGNRIRIADTLGGLTLEISDESASNEFGFRLDPNIPWVYEDLTYSLLDCDTLWFENSGLKPLDLHRLRFSGNLEFSVPPDQLPLILQPGERRAVEVCVKPRAAGRFLDTMIVEFFCNSLHDVVAFRSNVDPLMGAGSDLCGNPVQFRIEGFTKENFLESPVPNPTSKAVTRVRFGLSSETRVSLALYDLHGVERLTFLDSREFRSGIGQVDIHVDDIPSGEYLLVMTTTSGDRIVRTLVVAD